MIAKQLSVFIENRKGRLGEVLNSLKNNQVNIISMSLADTTEYGLLRLIVDKPEEGKDNLTKSGFSTMLTNILIIKIDHVAGSLQKFLTLLSDNDINVEYMYGLSIDGDKAFVVLKASDMEKADFILSSNGVFTISSEELLKI